MLRIVKLPPPSLFKFVLNLRFLSSKVSMNYEREIVVTNKHAWKLDISLKLDMIFLYQKYHDLFVCVAMKSHLDFVIIFKLFKYVHHFLGCNSFHAHCHPICILTLSFTNFIIVHSIILNLSIFSISMGGFVISKVMYTMKSTILINTSMISFSHDNENL